MMLLRKRGIRVHTLVCVFVQYNTAVVLLLYFSEHRHFKVCLGKHFLFRL